MRLVEEISFNSSFSYELSAVVEMPVASLRCEEPLQNGIVMTDEPGIYIAGKFGVRIEDMLLIDGETPRNLTKFPKAFRVLQGAPADRN